MLIFTFKAIIAQATTAVAATVIIVAFIIAQIVLSDCYSRFDGCKLSARANERENERLLLYNFVLTELSEIQ